MDSIQKQWGRDRLPYMVSRFETIFAESDEFDVYINMGADYPHPLRVQRRGNPLRPFTILEEASMGWRDLPMRWVVKHEDIPE